MAKSTAKLAKSKSRPGGLTLMIAIALAALAALAALPLVFVLVPGMTPTLVTLFVDRQRSRHVSYVVGVMNFAGVLPFLLVLAKDRLSMHAAALALSDPFTWLVMYGAAASGWMICAATPTLARFCLELQANNKRRALEVLGTAIRREWGDDVAGGQKRKGQPATDAQADRDNRP